MYDLLLFSTFFFKSQCPFYDSILERGYTMKTWEKIILLILLSCIGVFGWYVIVEPNTKSVPKPAAAESITEIVEVTMPVLESLLPRNRRNSTLQMLILTNSC
jgi:hypothetical protein